jgi:hypothetical protein
MPVAKGTVSLQEFQAAHERIFKSMDANKDGRLTLEEIQAFMQAARREAARWALIPDQARLICQRLTRQTECRHAPARLTCKKVPRNA